MHEGSDGKIPSGKLGEVLRILGANPSEEEVKAKVGSKTEIAFGEVGTILGGFQLGQSVASTVADAFSIFDIGGTGLADLAEVRGVLGNLGEKFDNVEVAELMRVIEVDADGNFDYSELVKFCEQYKVAGSDTVAVSGGGGQRGGEEC